MKNMRYAEIKNFEITNGDGIGVSLFVQGCHKHCKNCFNKSTWDFNGGKEFTTDVEKYFLQLCGNPNISRISFLGGEPLAVENIIQVADLIEEIKTIHPNKKIWLYTGYILEEITDDDFQSETILKFYAEDFFFPFQIYNALKKIIMLIDVLVDGEYIDNLKDLRYEYAGSTNQRLIDMNMSRRAGNIVLYKTKNHI